MSFINGGFRNGGFTLRLQSGTHHLDGAQALALARTRHNQCAPDETDLTRELRQQKLLLAMKSQILSFSGFIRLPWIAWALPQAIETDMDAPTLAGVLASLELNGNAHTALLYPTGAVTLPDGEQGLTITQSAKEPTWRASWPPERRSGGGRGLLLGLLGLRGLAAAPSEDSRASRSRSPCSALAAVERTTRTSSTRSRPSRAGASWCRSRCCRSRCP